MCKEREKKEKNVYTVFRPYQFDYIMFPDFPGPNFPE